MSIADLASCRLRAFLIIIVLAMLVLHGSVILSRGFLSIGLLAATRYLQAPSDTSSTLTSRQAVRFLRQAVYWNPANIGAQRGLGYALAVQGREDEAVVTWRRVPGIAEELTQRGQQAGRAKHYQEALGWYRRAAVVRPGFGDPWYYAGRIYESLELWEEAQAAYQQAVKGTTFTNLKLSMPYYQLGEIYQKRLTPPRLDKALSAYSAAIALDDFNTNLEAADSYYNRGMIYARQGRPPLDSVQEYYQSVALAPSRNWAYLRLGAALYQAYDDVALAEQQIGQALDLWPHDRSRKWPYRVLGDIYRNAGMIDKAVASYRQALYLDPDDGRVRRILSELGAIYTGVGHGR